VILAGGHVEHDVRESESDQDLRDERDRETLSMYGECRIGGRPDHPPSDPRGGRATGNLRHEVGRDVASRQATAEENGNRDRRVVMSAGNVAAGEHQRGEDHTDRQRREVRLRQDRMANGED
jgi:hypothetical protein